MGIPHVPARRQQQILEFIEKRNGAHIKELAQYFHVSEATIRRDLDEMSQAGAVERTHGGAIRAEDSTAFEYTHSTKMEIMLEEKQRIAAEAAKMVHDGDIVFLDSGTTAYFIAQNLANYERLTLITHNLYIAQSLPIHPSSSLIVTGGERRFNYNVLVGTIVEDFLRRIRVNISFLGCDAIDLDYGVSDANLNEASIKRLALEAAHTSILAADHSKFGRTALAKVYPIETVDYLITDSGLDAGMQEEIKKRTKLILA